jgi:hypothetical protein
VKFTQGRTVLLHWNTPFKLSPVKFSVLCWKFKFRKFILLKTGGESAILIHLNLAVFQKSNYLKHRGKSPFYFNKEKS